MACHWWCRRLSALHVHVLGATQWIDLLFQVLSTLLQPVVPLHAKPEQTTSCWFLITAILQKKCIWTFSSLFKVRGMLNSHLQLWSSGRKQHAVKETEAHSRMWFFLFQSSLSVPFYYISDAVKEVRRWFLCWRSNVRLVCHCQVTAEVKRAQSKWQKLITEPDASHSQNY